MGTIWLLSRSHFHTGASDVDALAREGRMRTQTTTFCFESEEVDAVSTGLAGEVEGVGDNELSSVTVASVESGSLSVSAAPVEVAFWVALDVVVDAADLVKGEDLAAEPTLAFLAMAATVELLWADLVVGLVGEARCVVEDGRDLALTEALEVRGEARWEGLRDGDVSSRRLTRWEVEVVVVVGVAAGLTGSGKGVADSAKGCTVRQGSEGKEASEVEGEGAAELGDEVEAEV